VASLVDLFRQIVERGFNRGDLSTYPSLMRFAQTL
jgi:hypothetical protein